MREIVSLSNFITEKQMPLWVIFMEKGKHARRFFHDHTASELVVILHGPALHLLDGRECGLQTGDVLVIHPGSIHAYDQVGRLELVNIIYDARELCFPVLDGYTLPLFRKIFPGGEDEIKNTVEPVLHLNEKNLALITSMIRRMDTELRSSRPGNCLYGLSQFVEIIIALCRLAPLVNPKKELRFQIGEAIAYMTQHYAKPVSIHTLARKVHMSRRNFFICFKNATGESPIRYLIKLRIMHACELLLYSEMPVVEIASQCGFSDSNYFCRKFRDIIGKPPGQFRKTRSGKHEQVMLTKGTSAAVAEKEE